MSDNAPYEMPLDIITKVRFSYKDVTIYQDGHLVVLDNDQIIQLAEAIKNERGKKNDSGTSDI